MGFELSEVALLDLLHERFAVEEIALEVGRKPVGHDEKLVVKNFEERDGTARGNQVGAPLKHQASVPKNQKSERERSGKEGAAG